MAPFFIVGQRRALSQACKLGQKKSIETMGNMEAVKPHIDGLLYMGVFGRLKPAVLLEYLRLKNKCVRKGVPHRFASSETLW